MASEEPFDPYANRCTVRIRVYLRADSRIGRIDGPITEGQNGYREQRRQADADGEFKLIGVYDATGSFIPYFPYDLKGQAGIDQWLAGLASAGFHLKKLWEIASTAR
jgi:hypothetical protein